MPTRKVTNLFNEALVTFWSSPHYSQERTYYYNRIVMKLLKRALEEIADGKNHKEKEVTFYVRVDDFEQLLKADHMEQHSQWSIKVDNSEITPFKGNVRVREVIVKDKVPEYFLTSKIKMVESTDDVTTKDNYEVTIPATEDLFQHFKRLSATGMEKDRYIFNVAGTPFKWELDLVVKDISGDDVTYHEWIKVDLEIPSGTEFKLPEFPIKFVELLTIDPEVAAQLGVSAERLSPQAMDARIGELYDTIFLKKNPFLKQEETVDVK